MWSFFGFLDILLKFYFPFTFKAESAEPQRNSFCTHIVSEYHNYFVFEWLNFLAQKILHIYLCVEQAMQFFFPTRETQGTDAEDGLRRSLSPPPVSLLLPDGAHLVIKFQHLTS